MFDIVTSGYMSIDRIIKIKSPLKTGETSIIRNADNTKPYYGGCPINVSYLLAKMGKNPLPILRVGDDEETKGFLSYLKEANVSLKGLETIENESSSNCYLISDESHDHVTIFYPGAMDSKYAAEPSDEFFKDAKMALITVGSYQDNKQFYRKCLEYNLPIVFGTKLDFDAFPEEFLKEIILNSKIIFSNENERQEILELFGITKITDLFRMGKTKIIVTTLGEKGSEYFQYVEGEDGERDNQHQGRLPIYPVKQVVDSSGAGDAYIAGFLYGYLDGKHTSACCEMGSVMSSFVIEAVGCTTGAPSKKDFEGRLKEFKNIVAMDRIREEI
ncbi:carbohydrate kinase family protein [Proteiniclasticum sp. SCR006]|uniref:Carbohydrate kinase family protein n=1 Tax=Proteiniclasticum aestuarii TaxID=2817862 RepID=A0A939KJI7_9CLOT|nr:PfkB family carbohydrate kinase [Proteiniclasticum aestuarii]MBO1265096.1 carbohydrate kinase family protein [Proteiniclasticum aestuarii]